VYHTSLNLAALPDPAVQVINVYAGPVWVNGQQVGVLRDGWGLATPEWLGGTTFDIPPAIAGSVRSIAVRCTLSHANWIHNYAAAAIRAGIRKSLIDDRIVTEHWFLNGLLPAYSLFLLVGGSGCFLLGFYLYDRSQRSALWLALYCLLAGSFRINSYVLYLSPSVPEALTMLWSTLSAFENWFAVLFFFSAAERRMARIYWVVFAAALWFNVSMNLPLLLPPHWALPFSLFANRSVALTQHVMSFAYTAPWVAFWPLNKLHGQRRAVAIACLVWSVLAELFYYQRDLFHWRWTSPVQTYLAAANLLVIAALVAIIFRNQRAVAIERARLSTEIESARQVQNQLVPAQLPATPHFRFEAAYHAASEVGGDFYQVFPLADASVLVAIGDVSGKGLKVAMLGTLLVGALRSLAQEDLSPAQILARLNAQLTASSDGGFVTCCIAHLSGQGRLTLANAGHLAPYRNGEEVALDSGFPLGIIAGAGYTETAFPLAPGDRLTFLSDGVAEARNPAGELFGFERAATISTQAAESIARAAQHFGQEDDITVLTLTFAPAEVLHA
jgi:phosphoserine phosphatase RsbU/P